MDQLLVFVVDRQAQSIPIPIDAGMDSLTMWAKTEPLVNEGEGWAHFKTNFE